jgi:protein-tyrosine phosphatase
VSFLEDAASAIGNGLRRARDRALHRFRARGIRGRLAGRRVRSVVAVCHGNLCRSPLLQASLARHLAARGRADIQVRSAGFAAPDRPSPELAILVARQMGYDLGGHRSMSLTAADLQRADLIIVMSAEQALDVRWRGAPPHVPVVVLGDLDPQPIDGRSITDPLNRDESVFRESYQRIDRCAEQLSKILSGNSP